MRWLRAFKQQFRSVRELMYGADVAHSHNLETAAKIESMQAEIQKLSANVGTSMLNIAQLEVQLSGSIVNVQKRAQALEQRMHDLEAGTSCRSSPQRARRTARRSELG